MRIASMFRGDALFFLNEETGRFMKKNKKAIAWGCALAALACSSGVHADILSGSGTGAVFAKLFPGATPPPIFQVGTTTGM